MLKRTRTILVFLALVLTFSTIAPIANAARSGNEFDAVCNHLKTKYHAKKVKIPFMWLARAVVGIVKPAGVKSFRVTIFKELQFSRSTLHREMQAAMRDSFSEDWSPILRVRARDGNQVYMNMREDGDNVRILLVTIDNDEAVVVRAKFSPDKLASFIENPKIFGISLDGGDQNRSDDS
ncbi:MAG: hypothetical protein KDB79_00900, partial [Acidobacteria bacterium]|nr:hypothetical protein [Acidobacteriota bacterium]